MISSIIDTRGRLLIRASVCVCINQKHQVRYYEDQR